VRKSSQCGRPTTPLPMAHQHRIELSTCRLWAARSSRPHDHIHSDGEIRSARLRPKAQRRARRFSPSARRARPMAHSRSLSIQLESRLSRRICHLACALGRTRRQNHLSIRYRPTLRSALMQHFPIYNFIEICCIKGEMAGFPRVRPVARTRVVSR